MRRLLAALLLGLPLMAAGAAAPTTGVQVNLSNNTWQTVQGVGLNMPVNVRLWGAKGDGVTDDTAAIQAAINWLQANTIPSDYNALGRLYFPRGTYYVASSLTITNGFGLIIEGDGRLATTIYFNTASGSLINVSAWIGFYVRDIAFINKSSTSYVSQTTKLFDMTPTYGGTMAHFENCLFENFANEVYVEGTVNGDTFTFDQCTFNKCQNGFNTQINSQAIIHDFRHCIANNISVALVNVTGAGMFHFDSCNVSSINSFLTLTQAASQYGNNSNYTFTNDYMEWNGSNTSWVNAYTGTSGDQYPLLTLTFEGCCLTGGSGASPTTPTLNLAGRLVAKWIGGHYEGTVRYGMTGQLEGILTMNQRAEVMFDHCDNAPAPSTLLTPDYNPGNGDGTPVFVYEGCNNMPDMEFGGLNGYSFRRSHVMQWYPAYTQVATNPGTNPYQTAVDFQGRTVKINSVTLVATGTQASGTKTAAAFSDSGYSSQLGTVSWTTTTAYPAATLSLSASPTVIVPSGGVTKLYLQLTLPGVASVLGFWQIDYTVLN